MVDLEAAEVTVEAVEVQCEVSLPMEIEEVLEVTAEILTRPTRPRPHTCGNAWTDM